MMYTAAERKLKEARTRAVFARPYYARGLLALRLIVSPDVPSFAVDEWWRLYASPGWIDRHDVGQIATALCHELQHVLLDHSARARAVGVTLGTLPEWWECSDCDINDGLLLDCQKCQPALPPLPDAWCVLPKHFGLPDGKVVEWYYAQRMNERREQRKKVTGGQTKKNGGAGDGGKGSAGAGGGHSGSRTQEQNYGCGSGSTGVAAPWEHGDPENSGVDGVQDADAWDIRRNVARDVHDHVKQKGRGSAPSGLLEWADELLRPRRIPWDRLLANVMRRASHMAAGAVQHSYTRVSRRQHAFGRAIMPAFRRPVPRIALVSDTSASMDSDQRALVRGVVDDACRHLAIPLRVIDVDAAVHRDLLVTSGRLAARAGHGGTDMRVGIAKALARPYPSNCVVVCTDCATPWPEKRPPGVHVIVAAIGATAEHLALVPAWATLVVVEKAV